MRARLGSRTSLILKPPPERKRRPRWTSINPLPPNNNVRKFWAILLGLWCLSAWADEVIPPAPARYFNDYANVVSPQKADFLNQTLEDFEKQSSDQILVVIF